MIDPSHPDPVRGFVGACLAVLVAFAPGWIAWHTAKDFMAGEIDQQSYLLAGAFFLGSIVLLVFLLRLAFRMFTGRGRRKDGGLVGPYLLAMFSLLAIFAAGFAFLITYVEHDWKMLVPAAAFTYMGVGGLCLAVKRSSNAN